MIYWIGNFSSFLILFILPLYLLIMYSFLIYKEPDPIQFLNSKLISNYLDVYNEIPECVDDDEMELVGQEYTMGHFCPVCYLYSSLKKNNEFRVFFQEFTFSMQFKPLFARTLCLYSCILIAKVLELCPNDTFLDKDYLIKLISPKAFILHFSIKNCTFQSLSSSAGISDAAPLYMGIIDKLNHVVTKEIDSETKTNTLDKTVQDKDYSAFNKSTFKKQIKDTLVFSTRCRGECQSTQSQIQYMTDMTRHCNINISDRIIMAENDMNDILEDTEAAQNQGLAESLNVFSSLFEKKRFTHLTWLRTFEPFMLKKNDSQADDHETLNEYCMELTRKSRYGQECVLCNLMCFSEWYAYLEKQVFSDISHHKGSNVLNLYNEYMKEKKCNAGKNALYDFIHCSLNYTDMIMHFLLSPLCQINRARANFFNNFSLSDTKPASLPCVQSVVNALLVQLIITYRQSCNNNDFLALKSILKKIIENLSHHDISVYESIFYGPVQ